MASSSLYVHFPFCETKCHYCDFYSLAAHRTSDQDRLAFAQALEKEAEVRCGELAPRLDTVFLGGGTPSMTDPAVMERALAPLWAGTSVDASTEWTMEANPSSIARDRMAAYRRLGVNRVSMGVQALRDDHLALLGRVHSAERAVRALDEVFQAGFENVSVDLLCGVPGQSEADLIEAIAKFVGLGITHLSCYLLTLPPHHRMYPQLPVEDVQLKHLEVVDRELTAAGFEHYEISNYCRPGRRARHNLAYWTGASYVGLGPSAHSFDAARGIRSKNHSSLKRYAADLAQGRPPVEWSETLTDEQRGLERWMLALRLDEGFPASWVADSRRRAKADRMLTEGLLMPHPQDPSRLRLTPKGFALSDQIVAQLTA